MGKPIVGHFWDAANLLSLAGLLSSTMALGFALNHRFELVGVCLILAFLADVYDGWVARRLKGRTELDKAFGANLDSLIDVIGAGVLPGVVLLSLGAFQGWYLPGAFILVAAATMRLSFFNVHGFGAEKTHYTGLPTDLVILAFTVMMLTEEILSLEQFRIALYAGAVLLAGLMVSPFQIRKLEGSWYYALPVIAAVVGLTHAARLLN